MSAAILAADRSRTVQHAIRLVLEPAGHLVRTASTGDEAWQSVQQQPPDLVMASTSLESLNGYQLAERMRKDPALRHVPLLLLVGQSDPFDDARAFACGAVGHLETPFFSDELEQQVHEALDASSKPPEGHVHVVAAPSLSPEVEAAIRQAVEKVAWEVVPLIAETFVAEMLKRKIHE